ncbi:MAG: GNAT family N-acetyltransferase [Chloroflexi bacterium]|nr:GNAT family N-acetyltransferase [Chloroflexota bacterium]
MLTIRTATPADLPELVELWHEQRLLRAQSDRRFQPTPNARAEWSAQAQSWIADANCGWFVAEHAHRPVGHIIGWLQPAPPGVSTASFGAITDIAIDLHGYHGGVGRGLVDALRAWFAEHKVQQVIVWVPRRQAVEQAFWRSLGATAWMDILWIKS